VYAEIFAFFDRLFFFHSIYPPFYEHMNNCSYVIIWSEFCQYVS
jgi:hypothetical protein